MISPDSTICGRSTFGRCCAHTRVLRCQLVQAQQVRDRLDLLTVRFVRPDPHEPLTTAANPEPCAPVTGEPLLVDLHRAIHDVGGQRYRDPRHVNTVAPLVREADGHRHRCRWAAVDRSDPADPGGGPGRSGDPASKQRRFRYQPLGRVSAGSARRNPIDAGRYAQVVLERKRIAGEHDRGRVTTAVGRDRRPESRLGARRKNDCAEVNGLRGRLRRWSAAAQKVSRWTTPAD